MSAANGFKKAAPSNREIHNFPFLQKELRDRLVNSKAVNLSDNLELKDLGNGYSAMSQKR